MLTTVRPHAACLSDENGSRPAIAWGQSSVHVFRDGQSADLNADNRNRELQELPNAYTEIRFAATLRQEIEMDVTSALSNDQVAILGCFGALAVCGLIAAITFHFGPAGKKSATQLETRHLRMPTPAERTVQEDKKAA